MSRSHQNNEYSVGIVYTAPCCSQAQVNFWHCDKRLRKVIYEEENMLQFLFSESLYSWLHYFRTNRKEISCQSKYGRSCLPHTSPHAENTEKKQQRYTILSFYSNISPQTSIPSNYHIFLSQCLPLSPNYHHIII